MAEKPQKPRVITRKHLVGLERERYLNRILLIGTGIIVLLILVLVGAPVLLETFVYPNQTVAEVAGEKITGSEFVARTRYYRQQLLNQYDSVYAEYYQLFQIFGDDEAFTSQYESALMQIRAQLDPQVAGEAVVNELVDEKLLRLEAQKLGIQISETQIADQLQALLAFYPDGTPTPQQDPTTAATSTLSAAQYGLVSPTPTPTLSPTPSVTPTVDPDASTTPEATPITAGSPPSTVVVASPTASPTATPYTLEGFQQTLADVMKFYADSGVSEQTIRSVIEAGLLRDAIKDRITADLPHYQEQVWARHILVATQEEALAVLDRLAAGEDWTSLAAELSIDESNKNSGGDLGWFPQEAMVEPFANAAFALSIGETGDPVESDFGWHIIQVLGHEDRPLSQAEYEQLRDQKMVEFIQGLRDQYTVVIYDTWKAMAPDEP
ncbi:MAG: peptidylprolyl isomerase [Anaerolineales bacterium]